jgi:hypothetical protein
MKIKYIVDPNNKILITICAEEMSYAGFQEWKFGR